MRAKIPPFSLPRVVSIALICASILLGGFVAQYFTWRLAQKVRPLTETMTFILSATGATTTPTYRLLPTTWIRVVQAGSFEWKASIPSAAASALAAAFVELKLKISIDGLPDVIWIIVTGGVVFVDHEASVSLLAGTYTVKIYAYYETKAVTTTISTSFDIKLWLVEAS